MFTVVYKEKGRLPDVFYTRYIAEIYASFCAEWEVRIVPGSQPYAQWGSS